MHHAAEVMLLRNSSFFLQQLGNTLIHTEHDTEAESTLQKCEEIFLDFQMFFNL